MRLAGSLESTSLGDVFGVLHRERVSGTLELEENRGASVGRIHRVHFRDGRVVGIDSALGARPLGELLVERGVLRQFQLERVLDAVQKNSTSPLGQLAMDLEKLSEGSVARVLRDQRRLRLEALFTITHAWVRFRVPRRIRVGCRLEPMSPVQFLDGRRRKRDSARGAFGARSSEDGDRANALAVLGLDSSASAAEIRGAFRRLASRRHPDRFPSASATLRARLLAEFAQISGAYHKLAG